MGDRAGTRSVLRVQAGGMVYATACLSGSAASALGAEAGGHRQAPGTSTGRGCG